MRITREEPQPSVGHHHRIVRVFHERFGFTQCWLWNSVPVSFREMCCLTSKCPVTAFTMQADQWCYILWYHKGTTMQTLQSQLGVITVFAPGQTNHTKVQPIQPSVCAFCTSTQLLHSSLTNLQCKLRNVSSEAHMHTHWFVFHRLTWMSSITSICLCVAV